MEFVFRNRLHMAKLRQKKESKQLHWFGGQCSKYVCLNKQSPKNNMPELGNNNMAAIRSLNHFFRWYSYHFIDFRMIFNIVTLPGIPSFVESCLSLLPAKGGTSNANCKVHGVDGTLHAGWKKNTWENVGGTIWEQESGWNVGILLE